MCIKKCGGMYTKGLSDYQWAVEFHNPTYLSFLALFEVWEDYECPLTLFSHNKRLLLSREENY